MGASGALVKMPDYLSAPAAPWSTLSAKTAPSRCAAPTPMEADHQEKFSIAPYGFIAMVQDSEGNLIGLHSMQ
jgi:predicted enzyme related to lactoylglutathione lyase